MRYIARPVIASCRDSLVRLLDKLPLGILIAAAIFLGLAPFHPEPHLWEKLKMLAAGTLTRPIDIFDLILHASFPLLLAVKLIRMATTGRVQSQDS